LLRQSATDFGHPRHQLTRSRIGKHFLPKVSQVAKALLIRNGEQFHLDGGAIGMIQQPLRRSCVQCLNHRIGPCRRKRFKAFDALPQGHGWFLRSNGTQTRASRTFQGSDSFRQFDLLCCFQAQLQDRSCGPDLNGRFARYHRAPQRVHGEVAGAFQARQRIIENALPGNPQLFAEIWPEQPVLEGSVVDAHFPRGVGQSCGRQDRENRSPLEPTDFLPVSLWHGCLLKLEIWNNLEQSGTVKQHRRDLPGLS
jgi:hypothetical protein